MGGMPPNGRLCSRQVDGTRKATSCHQDYPVAARQETGMAAFPPVRTAARRIRSAVRSVDPTAPVQTATRRTAAVVATGTEVQTGIAASQRPFQKAMHSVQASPAMRCVRTNPSRRANPVPMAQVLGSKLRSTLTRSRLATQFLWLLLPSRLKLQHTLILRARLQTCISGAVAHPSASYA